MKKILGYNLLSDREFENRIDVIDKFYKEEIKFYKEKCEKLEQKDLISHIVITIITFLSVIAILIMPMLLKAKTYTKKECKQYALEQVVKRGWTINDYDNLVKLWNKESNWNAKSKNKRTGACGIAQAYPCKKMKKYGKDYKTNCKVQIRWGLDYIKGRYKTPTKAWKHFKKKRWY